MNLKDIVRKRIVTKSNDYYLALKNLVDRSEDSLGHLHIRSKSHIEFVLFINWNRGSLSSLKRLEVTERILEEIK